MTPQELQRARRFVSAAARRRFLAGRIALRRILSHYCGVEPSRIPLAYRRHGKPYLKPPFSGLNFNLSHAGEVALLAVCEGANIGVDLERQRRIAAACIADSWLHQGERADLVRLSGVRRRAAFFRLWCRKEALSKAQGGGLRYGFHRFRVSTSRSRAEVLCWPEGAHQWRLYDLAVPGPFHAALAMDCPASSIRYREFA